MVSSYQKGVLAEELAVKQLKRDGYKILQKRYKTQYGEIDIIACIDGVVVFVEVKAHATMHDSLYAVTPRTRHRIEQSALWFLSQYPDYANMDMRFDVIAFSGDVTDKGICGQHLDNAWMVGS
ncbi:MAG: YraN family protein [Bdellovibrionales bacterium]